MYLYAVSDSVHISLHINKSQQQTYRHPLILLTGNHARTKTLARMCNLCLVIMNKLIFPTHVQLEMLECLRADQHDGHRHQADDNFGGWVKLRSCFSHYWAKVHEILGRLLFNVLVEPIMYIMFRSEDIRQ